MAQPARYRWEYCSDSDDLEDPVDTDSDSSLSGDDDECTPEQAGHHFGSLIVDMMRLGEISAMKLCILCYWASKAGAVGPVRDLAMSPGSHTSHYKRHVDTVLDGGIEDGALMRFEVPGHLKHTRSRTTHVVMGLPAHEALHHEFVQNQSVVDELAALDWGDPSLPKLYWDHPLVRDCDGARPHPLAMFVDGFPYTNTDSCIGFWVYSLISEQRHCLLSLRKRVLCRCGCMGWCTLFTIFQWLYWSVGALADGKFPDARFDAKPWDALDLIARAATSGCQLACKAIICRIKGDWMEFATTFGFFGWSSNLRPCLKCTATLDNMHDLTGASAAGLPWRPTTQASYDRACDRCEIRININAVDRDALVPLLDYDKTKDGSKGRALRSNVPHLRLRKHDRLEPNETLPDVGMLESIAVFPCCILFWRTSCETVTKHRNPLFGPRGYIVVTMICADILHTIYLGVMKKYLAELFWAWIRIDAWATGATTLGERQERTALLMRMHLWNWYKTSDAARDVTKLSDLTPKKLGSNKKPKCKSKGAETWGLMLWAETLLVSRGANFPPAVRNKWIAAGQALVQWVTCLKKHDDMQPVVVQELKTFDP